MAGQHQLPVNSRRNGLQTEQPTPTSRGSCDDVWKRMDDIYSELERNWRSGQFHLPLKFVNFHKTDVMFLFVRAAIGYSLAFMKVKILEKELLQMLQKKKRSIDNEDDQQSQQQVFELNQLKERVKRAIETRQNCTRSMSGTYARLLLHCSNFENHKEDERFFECVYFFVCSVVKLGVIADYWRPIEEELGFLFRGAQFSANIKLHATTAYQNGSTSSTDPHDSFHDKRSLATGGVISSSNNGTGNSGKKMQILDATSTKEVKAAADSVFEVPKSRISHFAPSVPVRRIVAELQATKNRAARNMELSQALRDRIRVQRGEDRRRQLEAVLSPRQSFDPDTLDVEISAVLDPVVASARLNNLTNPRISMRSTYTTRSPALNHLLPTTEERVKLALKGYEQELQEHRNHSRESSGTSRSRK